MKGPFAHHVRFQCPYLSGVQELQLGLLQTVLPRPLLVLIQTRQILSPDRHLQGASLFPGKVSFVGKGFPEVEGQEGGPSKCPALRRLQVEGPVEDARVAAAGVHCHLALLLQNRDAPLVAIREPVRGTGTQDPAADDGDIPRPHQLEKSAWSKYPILAWGSIRGGWPAGSLGRAPRGFEASPRFGTRPRCGHPD